MGLYFPGNYEGNGLDFDYTYSSRQQRQMSFGGVVGSIELCHLSPTWRIMLTLGLLTHVGKNSSFGLGRYRLEGKE